MNRASDRARLWSIILAGGEGERVKPMIQRWLGQHKPKQYCTFVGTRSMFQHTLDRAIKLTDPERTVVVIARGHRREAMVQLEDRKAGLILLQPRNRDTAAGLFLPLTYIRARDPEATVIVYPSDHFVYPENRFLEAVQQSAWAAQWLKDRAVLLGMSPAGLELDYGWIQPGEALATPANLKAQAVRAFLEKPSAAEADAALTNGALWNTLVLAASVEALWTLGHRCFPEVMTLFERLGTTIGTSEESTVLEAIYRDMPVKNFSTDLLQRVPDRIAVMELSQVLWSDWGKPARIANTLRRIGRQPAFPLECLSRPFIPISAFEGLR